MNSKKNIYFLKFKTGWTRGGLEIYKSGLHPGDGGIVIGDVIDILIYGCLLCYISWKIDETYQC